MQDMEEYDDYYEDEEEEYEEDEEEHIEEPQKPSAEELEYLELRQRIKEQIRKKMQRQNGAKSIASKKQPADNYGSFFGPSQPVIAQRVIQESKSLLENPHMAVRAVNGQHKANVQDKKPSSNQSSRNAVHDKVPRGQKETKMKVQQIKTTRDYSFLLSEDYQVPAPSKEPKPHSGTASKAFNNVQEARPAHVSQWNVQSSGVNGKNAHMSQKNVQSSGVNGKNVHGRHEERKVASGNSEMHSKAVLSRTPSGSKLTSAPLNSRRQLSSNGGRTHGQPAAGMKASHSNAYGASARKQSNDAAASAPKRSGIPVSSIQKKIVAPIAKNSSPAVNKQPPSRMLSSTANQHLEQRKPVPLNKAKVIPRQPVTSSRPQINNTVRHVSSHAVRDDDRPRKKPARQLPEDDDAKALAEIRKMFNTSRFAGRREDDDDSDMEANYDDILREEARSARIAKQEDEEEARLIEEEERRERMRRMKKRKLRE